MRYMLVTLDTSHVEMSLLNLFAPGTNLSLKKWLISVTAETSQDPMGPCGLLEQSDRHSLMAVWISSLDFGAHPMVVYY